MPTFLVESYVAKAGSIVEAAIATRIASGSGARLRWSLLMPDDEICFHLVEGPSEDVVREAALRAELRCQRISAAVFISAEDVELNPKKEEEI